MCYQHLFISGVELKSWWSKTFAPRLEIAGPKTDKNTNGNHFFKLFPFRHL